ncbi:NAD(P)-dependent oxidoreductase [Maribacter aurantiacus]|uniref:NADH-flavin reductase n=1 Tax=Maribacter aurantiacus TaxID=1882343 RepID=A0A5R8M0S8_9FLAO|nr:NAD(P)H-binding protein [Maribacter aurantiacus]TLF43195.1 NADH-flavin reductase [Maribacter aurantiacus]
MKNNKKIAVLGGGGRTGKFLVRQLIDKQYRLKLLLRRPEEFTIENSLIEIIKGDAVNPESIHSLLEGCQVVISTIGQRKDEPMVSSQATLNILESMDTFEIERYILVAGLNVDTPFDKKGEKTKMATDWMKANFSETHADRQKTYSILEKSDVNWTMVRVPLIEFSGNYGSVISSLEDCKGEKISASDIAAFIIEQLSSDKYFKKSPFIANS